jgi:hypothetical protein
VLLLRMRMLLQREGVPARQGQRRQEVRAVCRGKEHCMRPLNVHRALLDASAMEVSHIRCRSRLSRPDVHLVGAERPDM